MERLAADVSEISKRVKVNEESDILKHEKEREGKKAEGKRGIIIRPVAGVEWALGSDWCRAGVAVISAVLLAAVGQLCLYPAGVLRL